MKKFVAMLLALVMVFALCACGDKPQDDKQDKAAVKVGFICLHDENSTYDKNFIDAAGQGPHQKGLQHAVLANTLRQFLQRRFVKGLSGLLLVGHDLL